MSAAESFNDALIEAVKACGGTKSVGVLLWPAKGVEAAQRHLFACLNPDRAEKLSLDEVLHLMRLGRERGFHGVMQFLAGELAYAEPQPVEPRDEVAELLRQSIELQRQLLAVQQRVASALPAGQPLRPSTA